MQVLRTTQIKQLEESLIVLQQAGVSETTKSTTQQAGCDPLPPVPGNQNCMKCVTSFGTRCRQFHANFQTELQQSTMLV
jgi:hypothetical protein